MTCDLPWLEFESRGYPEHLGPPSYAQGELLQLNGSDDSHVGRDASPSPPASLFDERLAIQKIIVGEKVVAVAQEPFSVGSLRTVACPT